MATLMSIDESPLNQSGTQDVSLPASGDVITALNTFFGNTTWQGNVIQAAQKVGFLSGLQNTIDLALTNSSGGVLNGVDSGINDLAGNDILLYTDTTNNNLVLGKVGGTVMFALYLDATGSASGVDTNATGADLWMVEFNPIQHNLDGASSNDLVSIHDALWTTVTNPISFNATKAPSGSSLFVAYGDGTPLPSEVGVIVTAVGAENQSATGSISHGNVVKASQAGAALGGATFGINSQHFDGPGGSGGTTGDAAYFTFVKGLATDLTVPNLSQGEADVEANVGFTNLFGATKVSFVVCQLQGGTRSTVKIEALVAGVQDAGPTSAVSDDTPWTTTSYIDHQDQNVMVDIDQVTVTRGTSSWTFIEGQAKPAGAPSDLNVDFTQDGGLSAVISGAAEGDKITYVSNSDHDRLYIGAPGNSNSALATPFDIGAIKIEAGGTSSSAVGPLDIYDDGPSAAPTLNNNVVVNVDESAPSTAPAIDTGTVIKGVDPDNPDAAGGVALGAGNSGSAIVNPHASFGTDGAASSGSVTYALSVTNAASGLTLTDGSAISLQLLANGNIVGVVQGTGAFAGKAAFAISINSSSGVVTVEQYLSLHHGTAETNGDADEAVQASLNTIGVTVTTKDGDNDSFTSSAVDISHQISFHDDGPALAPSLNANASVSVDEGAPSTVPALSTGSVVKGVDPDNPDTAGGADAKYRNGRERRGPG
jgi:hypothetical protein